jgi:RNA polymerase sigma-70 factor (ECF subfamily)
MADLAVDFVGFWTRAQPEVRRYIGILVPRSADADDILQQTAVRLLEKFHEYEPARPFVPWAIRFAYHEVLAWRQRQARDRLMFSDKLLEQLHRTVSDETPLLEVRRRILDRCLQDLTEAERRLLIRRYSEHGSIQREADESQTSVHNLYYAIDKLRIRLIECINRKMLREGW